jgi:hypothetical protein
VANAAEEWAGVVRGVAERLGVRHEEVGGLNPRGGPAALCPGGSNRLTGKLGEGFWGASCDALEGAEDQIEGRLSRRRVEFESIAFNERFIATVPTEHDPTALRETFGPGFLDWAAGIEADVDFGVSERQLYFLWRLRERTEAEYRTALENAADLFRRIRTEVEEHGTHTYPAGPWHAGLEPFPGNAAGSDPTFLGP